MKFYVLWITFFSRVTPNLSACFSLSLRMLGNEAGRVLKFTFVPCMFVLFADAEIAENLTEQIICGELAGNFIQSQLGATK